MSSPLSYDVNVGDTYRVELPTGAVDYTATDQSLQCVILKPDGFELLSPPS